MEKRNYVKPYTAVMNVQTEGVIAASGINIDDDPNGENGFCLNNNFSAAKKEHNNILQDHFKSNCMNMVVGEVYCGYNDKAGGDVHFWALEVDEKNKATKIAYKKCGGC